MSELKNDANAKESSKPDLAAEVSLSLYEDSQKPGARTLTSGVIHFGQAGATSEDVQSIQDKRVGTGRAAYPHQEYFNQDFELDDRTSAAIAENPLTKEALPYAAVGYLFDRFSTVNGDLATGRETNALSKYNLEQYARNKPDASPLEKTVLDFATEHFDDLATVGGAKSVITPRTLLEAADTMQKLREGAPRQEDLQYLKDKFFSSEQADSTDGVTQADLKKQLDATTNPQEQDTIRSILANHSRYSKADLGDGASSKGGFKVVGSQYENADGITARDVIALGSFDQVRQRLGLKPVNDSGVRNYYETARENAYPNVRSYADQILTAKKPSN